MSLKIGTDNSDNRFLPSSNSSRLPRPRNAPRDKDVMRLEERSNNSKRLLLRNRPSGKVRSLFDDRSLNKEKLSEIISADGVLTVGCVFVRKYAECTAS